MTWIPDSRHDRGLMQVAPAVSWGFDGSRSDPGANIEAALEYTRRRYGSGMDMVTWKHLMAENPISEEAVKEMLAEMNRTDEPFDEYPIPPAPEPW